MNLSDVLLLPQYSWLFLVLPGLWLFYRYAEKRRFRQLAAVVGPRLPVLSPGFSERRIIWRRRLNLVAIAALMLALTAPTWGKKAAPFSSEGAAIMVALDVSRSMLAEDASPNRLARARAEIAQVIEAMTADRLGIVVFSGAAKLWAPLTRDRAALTELLNLAEPSALSRGGTNLAAAVDRALVALASSQSNDRRIYLLTDGEDLEGQGRAAAARAAAAGVRVFCLGLGSELGAKVPLGATGGGTTQYLQDMDGQEVVSRLDRNSLAALATAGDGRFQDALPGALLALDQELSAAWSSGQESDQKRSIPANRYQWPLLLGVLLLLAELALVDRRSA